MSEHDTGGIEEIISRPNSIHALIEALETKSRVLRETSRQYSLEADLVDARLAGLREACVLLGAEVEPEEVKEARRHRRNIRALVRDYRLEHPGEAVHIIALSLGCRPSQVKAALAYLEANGEAEA